MMNRPKPVHEMRQERFAKLAEMRRMLDRIDGQARSFTDDEQKTYKRLEGETDQLERDILIAEDDLERRRALADREIGKQLGKIDINPDRQFRNVGEMLHALARQKADSVSDARLDAAREAHEAREQQMGTGATGGYALPEQFDATLRQVMAQEGVVRSRATIIPAGSPPDAKLSFPALDQTSSRNMYGGVTLVHTGEGVTMTETEARLREVSFEPKEISAYLVATNKLLNNWQSAGVFLSRVLSQAMAGQEDYDFLRGSGVNQALGVINSPAAITYSRAGANAISFADCYGMMSRMLMRGGSYVWLASQTVIPQLAAMTDAGNHSVWVGSSAAGLNGAAGPLPSTLLGMPVVFCDRLPSLGTKGDLSLVNLSYYLVKDGSGPFVASSEHIFFTSNKTVFKIVWNTDGHPWLTEPLQLEGAAGSTVSPFVVLE